MNVKTIDLLQEINPADYLDARVILAFDNSETDADHEAAIGSLIRLTREIPVPFAVQGRIKRLEDVKKYLYTGAKRIVLTEDQEWIREEASARFGPEKLIRSVEEMPEPAAAFAWEDLKLNSDGMVPVVVQDVFTDQVLMLAYMNKEAYEATLRTGRMTYYSRSRQELWEKGATSGHYQFMRSLTLDCDNDTILAKVAQLGAACHTGSYSCFFQPITEDPYPEKDPTAILQEVYDLILDRKAHPKEGSYTNYLFDKGIDKILKKVGEEATEIVIAAKNPDPEETVYELSDFLYHAMVLMAEKGISWRDVLEELAKR